MKNDIITLECQIVYKGRWAPQMTWTDKAGLRIPSINTGSEGRAVRHEINVTVVGTDSISFSCLTDFNDVLDPAPTGNEANNTLDYEHEYLSGDIVVHCKFDRVEFYAIYFVYHAVIPPRTCI